MGQQAQSALPVPAVAYKPNWFKWWKAGFGSELMPIIPIDATLSPASKVSLANRGKVPGIRKPSGWVGYTGRWAETLFPKAPQLQEWERMGAGIGIQARKFNCADVDANDPAIVDALVEIVTRICGFAPVRYREGSPRRALMYCAPDGVVIRKWRIVFEDADGNEHAFEWLGYGQYWNVDGLHPSGEPYKWTDPHPCSCTITVVGEDQVAAVRNAILEYIDMMGFTLKASSGSGAGGSAEAKPLSDPSLHAPNAQLVLDVLAAVPCNEETFPARDEFVNVLRSIKASLGPAHQEHWPAVLQWALAYPGAEPGYIEGIWESLGDSALGWSYLSAWAGRYGYTGGAQHDFDEGSSPTTMPAVIPGPETPIDRMLARYVWCKQIERYVDLETNTTLSAKVFNTANVAVADYGRGGMNSAEAVFQNADEARKADIMTYRPGQGPWIKDENASGKTVQAINMWRPSGIVPAKNVTDDDVRPWLTHVELIFGPLHEPAATHFLDCVAYKLQHPGLKINHAILLWGPTQGTGKDSVFEPIFRIIGKHNRSTITPEMLAGQFTPYLQCEVVVVEEMMNFEKRATANKMKPNLACPPDTVTVNQKHLAPYAIPNIQWWVMFSNYEDAVPIEETDRRYWVHRCSLETPRDPTYYDALFAFYDNGGVEKIAGWLLARNVVGRFDPKAPPPMTDAKREMIKQTMPKQVRWVRDQFLEGGMFAGRSVLTVGELLSAAHHDGTAPLDVNHRHAATALRAEGFTKYDHHRVKIDGDARQFWVRDPSGLLSKLSGDQIRERYLLERNRLRMGEAA
jgi:hypothetical protein